MVTEKEFNSILSICVNTLSNVMHNRAFSIKKGITGIQS